jgi:5-amino-6-(5-phospho-D-ribitylamino)uracil phosphatase
VSSPVEPGVAASTRLLIGLDIDGTLLNEDETPSPGIVEAVAHAHARGHLVMLSTGRSWEATHHIQTLLGIAPDFAVCSNGAVIMKRVDSDDSETDASGAPRYARFHVETFDAREVLTLLGEHLPDARYLAELPDGRRLYTEHLDDWNLTNAERVPFAQLGTELVTRIVVVSPDHDESDFVALASRVGLNEVSYAVGWTAWLDIAPLGVDKGTALERVRAQLGVAPADVLVMGDGRNDLGMFSWALAGGGRAVSMGQAPDEVHAAAGERTGDVGSGGAAAILRSL